MIWGTTDTSALPTGLLRTWSSACRGRLDDTVVRKLPSTLIILEHQYARHADIMQHETQKNCLKTTSGLVTPASAKQNIPLLQQRVWCMYVSPRKSRHSRTPTHRYPLPQTCFLSAALLALSLRPENNCKLRSPYCSPHGRNPE